MKDSIFSRVFSYRQRENLSPLENFLTEIFAFCLESDTVFRNDVFSKLLSIEIDNSGFCISTQEHYASYGRPDIEITFGNTAILFECKVESREGENQLNDYASILTNVKRKFTNKHIVYLTKYFDHKELVDKGVELIAIRWYEVYELINENHNDITQQLKSFLKENNMEAVKNFTIEDLVALKTIPATISKMENILEELKPRFTKEFGNYSREKKLDWVYQGYSTLTYEKKEYYISATFWWEDDDTIPQFGLYLVFPIKSFENTPIIELLNKEFKNKKGWTIDDSDGSFCYAIEKPITDFITQDEDNLISMKNFVELNINTLTDLRKKYSKFLKKK